jgi:hypothetical protein
MYSNTRFGCNVADAFAQTPKLPGGLSSFHMQTVKNAAIGESWDRGHSAPHGSGRVGTVGQLGPVPVQVSTYAAAAKKRRELGKDVQRAANAPTRVIPQGLPVNTEQVFSDNRLRQMTSTENMAGHVPIQGLSLPQAQLGVSFLQQEAEPNIPYNSLAFSAGNGTQAHATGLPNNGMPYVWQGALGIMGDYAGTVTDPYSGQTYAAYTDAMQEPKVLNEVPVIKLGEPSRMLEAMTGTLSFPKPIPREHFTDAADVWEGLTLPQGYLDTAVEARIAQQAAGEAYMVNNETLAGYNDTNWDGYIGDTFVLRPVVDTQTLQDNSQTNTVNTGRMQAPQVNAAFQLGEGLGAHNGGYFQPIFNLLSEDKPSGPGRPKRDFDVSGFWSLPTVNTAGFTHRLLDTVNSRAGDPLFSVNLGEAMPAASDRDPVDRTQTVVVGQALQAPAPYAQLQSASDGIKLDANFLSVGAARSNILSEAMKNGGQLVQVGDGGRSLADAAFSRFAAPGTPAAINGGQLAQVGDGGRSLADAALSQSAALGTPAGGFVGYIPQPAAENNTADAALVANGNKWGPDSTSQQQSRMPFAIDGPALDAEMGAATGHSPWVTTPTYMPYMGTGPAKDGGVYSTQAAAGNNQAYGGNVVAPASVGKQGLNNVISMLAGSGVFGAPADATPVRPVSTGKQVDASIQSQPALRTAAAGVPTDLYLQPVGLGNWSADATISTVPQALEFQAGGIGGLPASRDGTMTWDQMVRARGTPAEFNLDAGDRMAAATENMVDARAISVPLRTANDGTLYWTGQSIGDQNLAAFASIPNFRNNTTEAAKRQKQDHFMFEHNARAHPMTYGTGAEFRNTYLAPYDRSGLVVKNPETERLMASPARLVMEQVAECQLLRQDAARARKHESMYASHIAYDSDFAASDMD